MLSARSSEWIPCHEVPGMFPFTPRQLARLAQRGEISVRRLLGARPAYLRSELEALVANSVRPSRHAMAGRSK